MERLGTLVYKLLFGDVYKTTIDPNKPENVPRINAMLEAEREEKKRFWEGPGKVLFDSWQAKVRNGAFELITKPDLECNCKTCLKIKELSMLIKLLADAEITINKE